jgi:segregation and condensation protein B
MDSEANLLEIEQADFPLLENKQDQIIRIIEALLFSTKEPLTLDKIRSIITTTYPISPSKLLELIQQMKAAYREEKRAFQIDEIAGGFLLRTVEEMAPFLELLHSNRRSEKLSEASIETLAIIAYKGPITRSEIDRLRGVDSSGTLAALIERGLVEPVGRKNAPGRPMQYNTTTLFMTYFGLKGSDDLAPL